MARRRAAGGVTRWLVDASNVIGSKPDGWWRDREGATERLLDALREFAGAEHDVVVVLDAGPAEWAGRTGPLEVAIAPRRGRDAADDEIARLLDADDDPASIRVVTSDATLADRARARGAEVVGAGEFRRRLDY
jgi:predicted RNA-binding protein with PIN domain